MGTWKKREAGLVEYVNGGIVNCVLCGKMIPRDIWVSINVWTLVFNSYN